MLSLLVVETSAFSPSKVTADLGGGCHSKTSNQRHQQQRHHGADYESTRVVRQDRISTTTSLSMIRGGAVLPVSKTVVAKLCTGFVAFNGISLLAAPVPFVKKQYKIDVEKDSLETYLLKAIGVISIGMSVNIYLSLIEAMTAQKAMGFALLPRFLYVLKSSLIGKDLEKLGGSKKFLSTNEVVMAWTTFSLLTGAGNPIVSAKVFSCMALLKGSFFVVNPVGAAKKFLGLDVSKEGKHELIDDILYSL